VAQLVGRKGPRQRHQSATHEQSVGTLSNRGKDAAQVVGSARAAGERWEDKTIGMASIRGCLMDSKDVEEDRLELDLALTRRRL
jgi:hypothetical protein